ncbi:MAG TPA: lyase family protein [Usitatibacter sp.]|jgi:3-carboxy-cis,cis-muconate cycloisomerase|nr:lyase family protein [Usitatibacter sp.]
MAGSLVERTLARPSFEAAFAAPAFVRAMLAFESALAAAQAAEKVIPAPAATAIAAACSSLQIDADALVAEGKRSASLAVPLVRLLRQEVARASREHAAHVHLGATSQDVLDTAVVLCLKPCLEEADRALEAAVRSLARLAREHRAAPMPGRTLMQPALPITAGLKIGRWAVALAQDRERLAEAAQAGLAVQLGGPVGALEPFGERGPAIRHRVAMALGIADARAWHVHRNAWIDLLGRMAQIVATAGKIARDVSLLAQPEVGEMLEAPPREGVGASSAMPHKRNPVGCAHALAAAIRMPGLLATVHAGAVAEHERALGGWQAELAVVPQMADALGGSVDFLEIIASGLVVNATRMKANVVASGAEVPAASLESAVDDLLADLAPYLT